MEKLLRILRNMAKKLLGNKVWEERMSGEGDLREMRLRLGNIWLLFPLVVITAIPLPATRASGQTLPTLPQATVDTTMPAVPTALKWK
jgi:hypothetical protein